MPLYERKPRGKDDTPRRVRTFPGSITDDRLSRSESWQLVDESSTTKKKTSSAGGDERSGTGSATVDTSSNGGS